MKDELRYIGEKVVQNHRTLAQNVISIPEVEKSDFKLSERVDFRAKLIKYFGQALYEDLDIVTPKITVWGKKTAESAIQYQVSLSDSLRATSNLRHVIWNAFTEELEQKQFAAITMLDVSKIIDPLIDHLFHIFGETYETYNNDLMKIAYTALEDLSVPVVPIVDGIAVIPIIGEIDTHRARLIMDISLNEGARLNLSKIILDLSGVAMIDTMVADKIFQVVKALKLTGVETIITGIRPELAQTTVKLGLDFKDIQTHSHLQQALKKLGVGLVF
ncbi:STAS domain-containing protein [Bacillus sp. V59.32b]|uniref:STAS domain-containing protein n=1 Tax=Bacillus sp. V59.32b TaxID=1758642 RepID=UPI000E3BEBC5|nr:STAS domain-containing protein [Bacillus sp. V59.32b]RFU61088.1 STAS domain-containing protein [Bacillus sp. V59.32b]